MISLVVCSVNTTYLQALIKNVDANIGVEHEWLLFDNTKLSLGLCEVYNLMAEKARYPYICFLHEDILIETQDWGTLLIEMCRHTNAGLIGVAGGQYKSKYFSGWYSGGVGLNYYSVLHKQNDYEHHMYGPDVWPATEVQVATIDGVFMFATREAWQQVKFNEELLKGFHYYDIDFSLRVAHFFKVLVTKKIKLIHFSLIGDFGDKWVDSTFHWHKHMENVLPFNVSGIVQKNIDMKVAAYWLDWLKNMNINWKNKIRWINRQQLYLHPRLWYNILKFLLYKPFRLKKIHMYIKAKYKKDNF